MVPGLYKTVWYNGKQFEYKEGFVSNRLGYIVGMPRLRQLRVKQGKLSKKVIWRRDFSVIPSMEK